MFSEQNPDFPDLDMGPLGYSKLCQGLGVQLCSDAHKAIQPKGGAPGQLGKGVWEAPGLQKGTFFLMGTKPRLLLLPLLPSHHLQSTVLLVNH